MSKHSPSHLIDNESWDSLATKLISIPISIGNEDKELLRLRKEMELIKHVMHEQLVSFNGNNTIDTAVFVGAIKSIDRIEKCLDKRGIKNNEFMIFLRMVLEKMKKQRLVVKKPLEMQKEFGKMKGVVEDADSV
jgi:hypothetical protein